MRHQSIIYLSHRPYRRFYLKATKMSKSKINFVITDKETLKDFLEFTKGQRLKTSNDLTGASEADKPELRDRHQRLSVLVYNLKTELS